MALLFLLFSLAYLLTSLVLGGYSLVGICIRPATPYFAAGLLVLVVALLLCAAAVGGVIGYAVLRHDGVWRWHELIDLGKAPETFLLLLTVLLPFCLCWPAVRQNPAVVVAVTSVCFFCHGQVCLLACAGA